MSIVTITLTDLDQAKGQYKADLIVEDSKTDDGFVTAAHVTGLFLLHGMDTPEFAQGCIAYGQSQNFSMRMESPVVATVVLTDSDLDAGTFDATLDVDGTVEEGVMTAAEMTGRFILAVMRMPGFLEGCTDYAAQLLGDREGTVNPPKAAANDMTEEAAA